MRTTRDNYREKSALCRRRKGFFLIFSLWLFLLLSVFCLGLGFKSLLEIRKTKLILNRTRALYLAASGVKLAQNILHEDSDAVDYLQEAWAQLGSQDQESSPITFSSPKKEAILTVTIEDEASRVNINDLAKEVIGGKEVSDSALKILLEAMYVSEAESKTRYIADYIDNEHPPQERDIDSEVNVKNADFSVPEELLSIKNIGIDDYDNLKDFVTVFTKKVNINTAKQELWEALIYAYVDPFQQEEFKADISRVRLGDDGTLGTDDDGHFGLEGEPLEGVLEEIFVTKSNIFRIMSKAEIEGAQKTIICIVDRSEGEKGSILYWHEE
jgi:type II secretory pathway component PulK